MRVGVLALQGGFAAHAEALRRLGLSAVEVRRPDQLDRLCGLVLPGGESSTLLHLMDGEPWFHGLKAFADRGGALFATCAGLILLARDVTPTQSSVGLLSVQAARNAYGRQVDSFEADLELAGETAPLHAVFIRAPRIRQVGQEVEVLARLDQEPVLVRQDRILAATFHPELTEDDRLHRRFLELCSAKPAEGRDFETRNLVTS